MQPTALIYPRVSTDEQAEHGTSLDTQIVECLKLARAEGYTVPESFIFREQASGATLDRPRLAEVRELVRTGQVGAVVMWSC